MLSFSKKMTCHTDCAIIRNMNDVVIPKPPVVILAAGNNSRFIPLNTGTHKGFLSLAGKPIIHQTLESLSAHGFNQIYIVVSPRDYESDLFTNYTKNNSKNFQITLILQESADGMGKAVLLAKQHIQGHFILASPYYINLGEIADTLWQQKPKKDECVLLGTQTTTPELYGMLVIDSAQDNKVAGIIEKPRKDQGQSDLKIDSIYLLNTAFLQMLANTPSQEYSLETALAEYAQTGSVAFIRNTADIQSLKYPWHLFRILEKVWSTRHTNIDPTAKIATTAIIDDSHGPVVIAENAKIGDFAKLVGPCYIGKNCLVGDYSFVRGSSLETGSIVGAKTEVVRSILFEGATIHFGYLADSILGANTKIGAGLITANKRLDRKNIRVQIKEELIDTGTNTLGIVTGAKSSAGISVNTMPGVIIGAGISIPPATTLFRNQLASTNSE